MNVESEPAKFDAAMLAAAFPGKHATAALLAGEKVSGIVDQRYRWGTIAAKIEGETVLIPRRLHFVSHGPSLSSGDMSLPFSLALETRSTDGYHRQRALNDLFRDPQPWIPPFVVLLIGEYVIEILDDIFAALTPEMEEFLGDFIARNRSLWDTTKRQVSSYWNAYYRGRSHNNSLPAFSREDYVGFKIVGRLEAAASAHRPITSVEM